MVKSLNMWLQLLQCGEKSVTKKKKKRKTSCKLTKSPYSKGKTFLSRTAQALPWHLST